MSKKPMVKKNPRGSALNPWPRKKLYGYRVEYPGMVHFCNGGIGLDDFLEGMYYRDADLTKVTITIVLDPKLCNDPTRSGS